MGTVFLSSGTQTDRNLFDHGVGDRVAPTKGGVPDLSYVGHVREGRFDGDPVRGGWYTVTYEIECERGGSIVVPQRELVKVPRQQ